MNTTGPRRRESSWTWCLLAAIVAIQALLLTWSARVHSPTFDETSYLVAGLSHWKYGRFDLYTGNPPLVRTIAAAPIHFFMRPKVDWTEYPRIPDRQADIKVGRMFMLSNGRDAYHFFFVARVAVIPIALIGTVLCYLFASGVFHSERAGISAAIFWAFSPQVLGHGSLITPDVCSTVSALAAMYVLWRFLKRRSVSWAVALAFTTSLAMLTRSFWLALPLIQLALVCFVCVFESRFGGSIERVDCVDADPSERSTDTSGSLMHSAGLVVASSLLAVFFVNCFYGFQGTLHPLCDYTFVTWRGTGTPVPPLKILDDPQKKQFPQDRSRFPGEYAPVPNVVPGNRFVGSWLEDLPIPLPRRYLEGVDLQWRDVELGFVLPEFASYFGGKWQQGGWWYFYLVGVLVTTPLPLLACVVLSGVAIVLRGSSLHRVTGLICLLCPALFVLLILTTSFGLHRHLRYVMPVIPLFAVVGSGCYSLYPSKNSARTGLQRLPEFGLTALLALYIWGSVSTAPHWSSYFNWLAGGPENGEKWFLDSNVDWGQDLPAVEDWLDKHQEVRDTVKLAYFGSFCPADVGLAHDIPLPYSRTLALRRYGDANTCGPVPGWFIVSKNYIEGSALRFVLPHGNFWQYNDIDDYGYFREFKPVDRIGYSMLVYHLTEEDVNPVRVTLGLDPITKGPVTVTRSPMTNSSSDVNEIQVPKTLE